jgi:hypothetical protein
MPLPSKKPARRPSQKIRPLAPPSKQSARPTIPNPDSLGFFPALSAQLQQAYFAQLSAFLRRNLIVGGVAPAVLRSIFAAVQARGQPVSVDLRVTVSPPDASGFFPADGQLITPLTELAAEAEPTAPDDDPEYGPSFTGLFGETVRMRRPKRGWGKGSRRR